MLNPNVFDTCIYAISYLSRIQHPLFRSLQGDHKGDVYTKCFHVGKEHGPRQPWHDIHSAVVGPEALDLVQAFSERWLKQAGKDVDDLVNIHRLGLGDGSKLVNDGGWCTQLSRSIDSRVNAFDASIRQSFKSTNIDAVSSAWSVEKEKNTKVSRRFESALMPELKFNQSLDQKKGRLVDSSIHAAHIHHIRRAKHSIYIESQYFMGSSSIWCDEKERDVKCSNMIAQEVSVIVVTIRISSAALTYLGKSISVGVQNLRKDCNKRAIYCLHFAPHVDGGYSSGWCDTGLVILSAQYH